MTFPGAETAITRFSDMLLISTKVKTSDFYSEIISVYRRHCFLSHSNFSLVSVWPLVDVVCLMTKPMTILKILEVLGKTQKKISILAHKYKKRDTN